MELVQHPALTRRRRPRWLIIGSNVWHNFAVGFQTNNPRFQWDGGATHPRLPLEKSTAYIRKVFEDYLAYSSLTPRCLLNKRILEIGPGDNLGVALRFIAAGAGQVVCLDRLFARRNDQQQQRIYSALRSELSEAERVRFDHAVSLSPTVQFNPDSITFIHGTPIERAPALLASHSFDLIVSRAVVYEIHQIDMAFAAMDQLLVPGGMMIHKIAFLDWMFSQNNYHELEYLTVPDSIYRLMTSNSGKSNRRMINYYRNRMDTLGYSATFQITQTIGPGARELPPGITRLREGIDYTRDSLDLIRQIRSRLRPQFRKLPDDDLLVKDMFLVAVKPEK